LNRVRQLAMQSPIKARGFLWQTEMQVFCSPLQSIGAARAVWAPSKYIATIAAVALMILSGMISA
jgi:hypothetical protein